jgi:integrase
MTKASGALPADDPLFAPGLHRRPRAGGEVAYFIPPRKDVASGYRPKCITLPADLSEAEVAENCRRLWSDLLKWRMKLPTGPRANTIAWLVRRYLNDPESPYNTKLGHRSQRTYKGFSQIIAADVGERRIDPDGTRPRILGAHVRDWHRNWTNERGPSMARHLIVQFRILVKYAVELGTPGAKDLRDMLHDMRFSQPLPRSVAPTRAQVDALVSKAVELGRPSIAAVSLAQFELIERRAHIIGAYEKKRWRPGWTWQAISDDWTITYHQTKVGRIERIFDLKTVPALFGLLQATPNEKRIGAVFKDELTGEPWRERHYAEVFREIAKAAGWPDELKSMDLRAGGMTEADAIDGIPDRYLQDAAGHTDPKTKDRYRRDKQRNAQNVVELRQKAKVGDGR